MSMPAPSQAPPVIDVALLSRHFGARVAVEDVSFTVHAGEIVALLGPNGAGKTTTLRMLAGLLAPTSGGGTVAGVSLTARESADVRPNVGLLTETPGLWDRLSVSTNLLTHARLHGLPDPANRVRDVLEQLGLSDRTTDRAAQLSKGLRQRVALARALLHRPAVLLLDEPTSGLDPAAARSVRDLVSGLAANGAAVVLCTHDLREAETLAHRIGLMRTRLVDFGTLDDLGVGAGRTLEAVYLSRLGDA